MGRLHGIPQPLECGQYVRRGGDVSLTETGGALTIVMGWLSAADAALGRTYAYKVWWS